MGIFTTCVIGVILNLVGMTLWAASLNGPSEGDWSLVIFIDVVLIVLSAMALASCADMMSDNEALAEQFACGMLIIGRANMIWGTIFCIANFIARKLGFRR